MMMMNPTVMLNYIVSYREEIRIISFLINNHRGGRFMPVNLFNIYLLHTNLSLI